MREYFGETIDYVKDEMHKVVPWKSVFSFELYNNTEYTLRVKIGSFNNFTTVNPRESFRFRLIYVDTFLCLQRKKRIWNAILEWDAGLCWKEN